MGEIKTLIAELGNLKYQMNVPAKEHTSFRIGGPMALFSEPNDANELIALLNAAKRADYPVFVFGNGSNLLISDEGVDALFIKIGVQMSKFSIDGTCITADAGALLCRVARESVNAGLMGLEWAAGIPGSIGGGAAMNAGAYGGELKQVLKSVFVVKDGELVELRVQESDLGYRKSAFSFPDYIVTGVRMELMPDDGGAKLRMEDYNERRRSKQPLEYPSAGSTFKRPEGHFAGKLIEDAGLKGMKIGNAMVSEKHAGFIVNTGGATFDDVMNLIRFVQDRVHREFGVMLEPEVKILDGGSILKR